MPVDKFDIPFIYPTKSGGFTYFQSSDILDDSHFNGEGDVTDSGSGQWTFETDGPTSVQIFKNSDTANSIGGCNMDFADTLARGYAYKKDDPRDVEITFLIKFVDAGSDNGFAIEGPTGRHSGDGCCQGFAYKIDIQFQENPPKFRFRKEMWHVSNHTDPKTGTFTNSKFNFNLMGHDDFVGFKYIHYVKKDGVSSGTDSVVLELWGNTDPDSNPNDWFLIKRTEDKGGWGNDGDECNGDNDQIGAWSNSNFRLKSNTEGGTFVLKHLSLREIDPAADFDDDPSNPGTQPPIDQPATTQTIVGSFALQYDINVMRTNPCSASGDKSFFEWISDADEQSIGNNIPADGAKRFGELCGTINSSLYQKKPSKFDVKLMKVGSPAATPTVKATIRGPAPDFELIYTSPTEFDPSALTGSLDTKTFDFSTNTHEMQVGDKICVEHDNTDSNNYVKVGVREQSLGGADGTDNSKLTYFDGNWHNSESRDLACIIYEDA